MKRGNHINRPTVPSAGSSEHIGNFIQEDEVNRSAKTHNSNRTNLFATDPAGLSALMERQGVKPYDLFQRNDELMTFRVIFRDLTFGTPVWMLDFSPTVDHSDTSSVWSPWNPDGSTLYISGARPQEDGVHRGWFFNTGFSRLRPGPSQSSTDSRKDGRPAVWSSKNPDLYYGPIDPSNRIFCTNRRTGKQDVVSEWEPMRWKQSKSRVYGLTSDGRYIFVDTPNRGIWVPFENREDLPIPRLRMYDGRPVFQDGAIQGSENRFPVIYGHRQYGDMIGLRTGMLIDLETGEITNIAAPLCGNINYLRAFHEGRVKYPRNKEWCDYGLSSFQDSVLLPEGLNIEELRALWLNLPHATHGHESISPDREYIAVDAGSMIHRVRDGATHRFKVTSNGQNYHLHWQRHPRFFVSWVRGWRMSYGAGSTGSEFTPPDNANIEFQVFCDTSVQPIVNTGHRFNAYYAGGDFSMLSPDATKINYGSSMTGRFRTYIAVMARPRPPRAVTWHAEDNDVILSWIPSEYSRETNGYLVYRGEASGGPYKLKTPTIVQDTTWRDTDIQTGKPYFYVITALEHSGLESGYSEEAALAGIELSDSTDTPLVIYAEAEAPLFDLPTDARPGLAVGVDRYQASDWYYLYRHPEARNGKTELKVNIPAAGNYRLWARMRSSEEARTGRWTVSINDLSHTLNVSKTSWTWVRADGEERHLPPGPVTLTLETADTGAQLDLLCLATDRNFIPNGPRPENRTTPDSPSKLNAENIRERVNRLVWQPTAAFDFSHYQVYVSREADFIPDQSLLIGSPTEAGFIDWGLRADTRYHYAVTVVDRRGNESAPARAEAATPPGATPPFEKILSFTEAELTGQFDRVSAAGLRARQYVVPRQPDVNRAVWQLEIPREGPYYLWLRHLRRDTGGRGGDIRQEIRVLANGKHVFTLGGGLTDFNVPDTMIAEGYPLAERLWTWAWPGETNLEPVILPVGEVELTLENFPGDVRYDVLLITDEPSYIPQDGRLRQR